MEVSMGVQSAALLLSKLAAAEKNFTSDALAALGNDRHDYIRYVELRDLIIECKAHIERQAELCRCR
jgi:hypothetical protein